MIDLAALFDHALLGARDLALQTCDAALQVFALAFQRFDFRRPAVGFGGLVG